MHGDVMPAVNNYLHIVLSSDGLLLVGGIQAILQSVREMSSRLLAKGDRASILKMIQ
jgi:hypothetical protein